MYICLLCLFVNAWGQGLFIHVSFQIITSPYHWHIVGTLSICGWKVCLKRKTSLRMPSQACLVNAARAMRARWLWYSIKLFFPEWFWNLTTKEKGQGQWRGFSECCVPLLHVHFNDPGKMRGAEVVHVDKLGHLTPLFLWNCHLNPS